MDELGETPFNSSSPPEVSTPEADPAPTPTRRKKPKATIKLLNKNLYDGNRLIYDVNTLQAYLVPEGSVKYSFNEQEVDASVLDEAIQPYDWTEEIEAIMPDVTGVRLAIWRNGYLSPEDLGKRNPYAPLYGAFPSKLEK